MIIDLLFCVLLILACIKGYRKGLIIAVFSVIALIAGLAAALKLSAVVADNLRGSINLSAKWLPFVSFAIVFFAVVFLVYWGGKLVEKTFQMVLLGWVNRLGGIILYVALYTVILSIFLFFAEKMVLLNPSEFHSSFTYPFIQPWGHKAIDGLGKIIPVFKDMFRELETFFDGLPYKSPL